VDTSGLCCQLQKSYAAKNTQLSVAYCPVCSHIQSLYWELFPVFVPVTSYSTHIQQRTHTRVFQIIPFGNRVNVFTGICHLQLLRLSAVWQSIHVFVHDNYCGHVWALLSVTAVAYSQNHTLEYQELSCLLTDNVFTGNYQQ